MSIVTAHSVAEPSSLSRLIGGIIVATYAIITILPLLWIFLTGFKTPPDSISYPPKIISEPSVEGYVNLFTTRSRQTPEFLASLPPPQTWYERLVRSRNMVIAGPSKVVPRFVNSMVIGFGSTFLAVCLGTIAAYAFSRFRVPLADDLLFLVVGAFDEDIRLELLDDPLRRILVEKHDGVDPFQGADDLSARALVLHGPDGAFETLDRRIRVERDDQPIADRGGLFDQRGVPGMQQVEAAVGEADRISLGLPSLA